MIYCGRMHTHLALRGTPQEARSLVLLGITMALGTSLLSLFHKKAGIQLHAVI